MTRRTDRRWLIGALLLLAGAAWLVVGPAMARAQSRPGPPPPTERIGVEQGVAFPRDI
jgi:hypothetical protein